MSLPLAAILEKDWFGAPVAARPEFSLRHDFGAILLAVKVGKSALVVPNDDGGYTEGLWQGDCAELFLVNPETGYYLEFNLSPKGGWWSCAFTAPRVRAPGEPVAIAGVATRFSSTPDFWEAELTIPLVALPEALEFAPGATRGNVTFCLGDSPQVYLTYADLGGGTPDFHLPAKWPRLFDGRGR